MSQGVAATLHYRRGGVLDIEAPFDAAFVRAIKTVPATYRAWSAERQAWRIYRPYLDVAARTAARHFTVVEFWDDPADRPSSAPPPPRAPRPPEASSLPEHFAVLHLLPTAPPELVEAAYRVVAKRCHPDFGGDTVAMQRVNAAREALRKDKAL